MDRSHILFVPGVSNGGGWMMVEWGMGRGQCPAGGGGGWKLGGGGGWKLGSGVVGSWGWGWLEVGSGICRGWNSGTAQG